MRGGVSLRCEMYHHQQPRRIHLVRHRRHPLLIGTAALSLLASALPSSAFVSASSRNNSPSALARPNFARGGQSSMATTHVVARNMSGEKQYAHAPPAPAVSPFSRPVKTVAVVGGTHGNEYTGVWCIKVIERQREIYNNGGGKTAKEKNDDDAINGVDVDDEGSVNVFERFPSLDISTLLANPVAYMENKRFVDVDLNREFSQEKLRRVPAVDEETMMEEECDMRTDFCYGGDVDSSLPHEAVRAREIESLLGPKFADGDASDADSNTDVVVDLHTTTSNMGISLIVPEGDPLMAAAAAYVMHKCLQKYGPGGAQCLLHAMPKRRDRLNLSSCGRHGFTIEVGPTPQGVIRHDVVEKTQVVLHALLEFLHMRNVELNADGDSTSAVLDRLGEIYPGGIVQCYRSAPAIRPGELSGKIRWPNSPTNPNFPELMVHGSVQDRDFHPLRVGDPLFVQLDGTVVPYDGSHGEEVHLIFVNEGGYYYASSGTGIGVAVKSQFDWRTGWFVVESDDEEGATEEVVVEENDSYE